MDSETAYITGEFIYYSGTTPTGYRGSLVSVATDDPGTVTSSFAYTSYSYYTLYGSAICMGQANEIFFGGGYGTVTILYRAYNGAVDSQMMDTHAVWSVHRTYQILTHYDTGSASFLFGCMNPDIITYYQSIYI